jgi:TRAP-type mannitol/chloroaromatic compound transport system permease small subunit
MRRYVCAIDAMNYRIGRVMMYGIFAMMGILFWSSLTKVGSDMGLGINPSLWTLETAQFAMVAYYMIGGSYAIQMGSNVRMDLFYGNWSAGRKAWVDAFTVFFLIFYLAVLLWGGLSSASYSLGDFKGEPLSFFGGIIAGFFTGGAEGAAEQMGVLERSNSVWRAYLWPIKLLMVFGIFLMLLQAISELFKDIFRIRGLDR